AKMRVIDHLGDCSSRLIKSNDLYGDCGTTIGFLFDSERQARQFIKLTAERALHCSTPADSGRHIYSNWEVVMNRRGAHSPLLNPFTLPENRGSKVKYTAGMCPQTLDVLKRTVFLGVSPSWTATDTKRIAQICKQISESVT
ncbi:MAG TPA: hypothetical protein PKH07_19650, partial [bacterium]|nr:hypothetical protein [bacterium]